MGGGGREGGSVRGRGGAWSQEIKPSARLYSTHSSGSEPLQSSRIVALASPIRLFVLPICCLPPPLHPPSSPPPPSPTSPSYTPPNRAPNPKPQTPKPRRRDGQLFASPFLPPNNPPPSSSTTSPPLPPLPPPSFPSSSPPHPPRIDLSLVLRRLRDGSYATVAHFADDVRLIFSNAMTLHLPGTRVYKAGRR